MCVLGTNLRMCRKMVGSESFRACSVMRGHLTTVEHLVTVNAGMMMQKKFYGPPLLAVAFREGLDSDKCRRFID